MRGPHEGSWNSLTKASRLRNADSENPSLACSFWCIGTDGSKLQFMPPRRSSCNFSISSPTERLRAWHSHAYMCLKAANGAEGTKMARQWQAGILDRVRCWSGARWDGSFGVWNLIVPTGVLHPASNHRYRWKAWRAAFAHSLSHASLAAMLPHSAIVQTLSSVAEDLKPQLSDGSSKSWSSTTSRDLLQQRVHALPARRTQAERTLTQPASAARLAKAERLAHCCMSRG